MCFVTFVDAYKSQSQRREQRDGSDADQSCVIGLSPQPMTPDAGDTTSDTDDARKADDDTDRSTHVGVLVPSYGVTGCSRQAEPMDMGSDLRDAAASCVLPQTLSSGDCQKEQLRKENMQKEKLQREQIEKEKLQKEKLQKEKLQKEKLQREQIEKEKLQKEKLQKEKLQKEKLQREQIEKEKLQKEKLQREQLEKEKLQKEKLQREQLEKEKWLKEKLQREQLEKEKLQREQLEKEKLQKEKLQREQLEKEQWQKEKLQREQLEKEKLQKEKLQKEKLQKEQLEKEKLQKEKLQKEKLQRVQLEKEKLQKEKLQREQLEKEKLQKEKLQREQLEKEKRQKEKLQKEKLQRVQLEKEKLQKEKLQREQLEKEKLQKEKLQREQLEREKLQREKLQREQLEKEKLQKEKLQREQLEREKMQKEKLQREQLEKEKLQREKLKKEKLQREQLEKEKLQKEKMQKEQMSEATNHFTKSPDINPGDTTCDEILSSQLLQDLPHLCDANITDHHNCPNQQSRETGHTSHTLVPAPFSDVREDEGVGFKDCLVLPEDIEAAMNMSDFFTCSAMMPGVATGRSEVADNAGNGEAADFSLSESLTMSMLEAVERMDIGDARFTQSGPPKEPALHCTTRSAANAACQEDVAMVKAANITTDGRAEVGSVERSSGQKRKRRKHLGMARKRTRTSDTSVTDNSFSDNKVNDRVDIDVNVSDGMLTPSPPSGRPRRFVGGVVCSPIRSEKVKGRAERCRSKKAGRCSQRRSQGEAAAATTRPRRVSKELLKSPSFETNSTSKDGVPLGLAQPVISLLSNKSTVVTTSLGVQGNRTIHQTSPVSQHCVEGKRTTQQTPSVSQGSQSFTIIDVAADRQLFESFIAEWRIQSLYSLSVACEKVPADPAACIGGKFNGLGRWLLISVRFNWLALYSDLPVSH